MLRRPNGGRRRSASIPQLRSSSANPSCASCYPGSDRGSCARPAAALLAPSGPPRGRRARPPPPARDLTEAELAARSVPEAPTGEWLAQLRRSGARSRRGSARDRWIAAEDVARYRDALGIPPPPGIPARAARARSAREDRSGIAPCAHPRSLPGRDVERRLGMEPGSVQSALDALLDQERLVEGKFLPAALVRHGTRTAGAEGSYATSRSCAASSAVRWPSCARRWSRSKSPLSLACRSRGTVSIGPGPDSTRSSRSSSSCRALHPGERAHPRRPPARVRPFKPADLDLLAAAGEIVWRGVEPIGPRDGGSPSTSRALSAARPAATKVEGELPRKIRDMLGRKGELLRGSASRDFRVSSGSGGGPLVDGLGGRGHERHAGAAALAARGRAVARAAGADRAVVPFAPAGPPGSEGRWSLLPAPSGSGTERSAALAQVLLARMAS